jgi:hypothetical protein
MSCTEQEKAYSRAYYHSHKAEASLNHKLWEERNMHPCEKCGEPCHHGHRICQKCYETLKAKGEQNCKICGQHLYKRNETGLCNACACREAGLAHRAENSPYWKGGETLSHGYVYVYAPGHPRATNKNRVFEHILVWEKAHGYALPESLVVHHLNGIKTDNRPENLIAVTQGEHMRLHWNQKRGTQNKQSVIHE